MSVNYALHKRLSLVLILIGPIASLAVSPVWNYDPINLIKLLFICSASFYCIGLLVFNSKNLFLRIPKSQLIAMLIFLVAMLSALFFSGAPINQQIWGTFGRNTGFLTYFSLLALLIASAYVEIINFYKFLVNALVLVSIPMTGYCLIQVAGLDPVGWSEKHPFGTLGNINFSSAFFGLSTLCALALIAEKSYKMSIRISLFILVIVDLLIVTSTGSIQGLMMFVAGAGIQGFIYINRKFKSKLINFFYILLGAFATGLTVIGLANKGPLAKFLYAPSIVFRSDYWHAGWAMTLKFPFFGVGLDSYGDWYRTLRGEISTLRTGPDRISNTAHNIFLDLSSNGGFPLLLAYLALLFFAFVSGVKFLKKDTNPHSIAIFTSWIGFLIFSSISIAQVGVGIWGWLFTGALLGLKPNKFSTSENNFIDSNRKKRKKIKEVQLRPSEILSGFLFLFMGFIFAYIPFQADVKYKTAIQTRALDKMIESTKVMGSTSFHQELVLGTASSNNYADQAYLIAKRLVTEYPRDYFGWKALYLVPRSNEDEKKEALRKLRELDPFNPEFK